MGRYGLIIGIAIGVTEFRLGSAFFCIFLHFYFYLQELNRIGVL